MHLQTFKMDINVKHEVLIQGIGYQFLTYLKDKDSRIDYTWLS